MTHDEKIAYLLKDLGQRGIGKSTAAPRLYRWLWSLGIEIRPPLFARFWSLAVWQGLCFGIFWGILSWLWFVAWQGNRIPVFVFVVLAASAGGFFGLFKGTYYRWRARKLALPRWEDYPYSANIANTV